MKDFETPFEDCSYMTIKSRIMQGHFKGSLFLTFEEGSTGRSSSVVLDQWKAKKLHGLLERYLQEYED